MNLAFTQRFPERMGGGPTHFVEKIWAGLDDTQDDQWFGGDSWAEAPILKHYPQWAGTEVFAPKLHTLREDPHDRWKVGMKIHFVINNRTPQRYQFAPTGVCTAIQKVGIEYRGDATIVFVDDRHFTYWGHDDHPPKLLDMALNDGFESVYQFFQWFNKPWQGKIIHWDKIRY